MKEESTKARAEGLALWEEGKWEAALAVLDKAITSDPDEAWLYLLRGEISFSVANDSSVGNARDVMLRRALADFQRAFQTMPKSYSDYLRTNLWGCYRQLGMEHEATHVLNMLNNQLPSTDELPPNPETERHVSPNAPTEKVG